jgi:hypothetical protein
VSGRCCPRPPRWRFARDLVEQNAIDDLSPASPDFDVDLRNILRAFAEMLDARP